MIRTLIETVPLALAATLSPSGLLFVMIILSGKDKPKPKALQFVIGATTFLIALGLLALFTFKPAVSSAGHPNKVSAILDIVFGVGIALVIGRSTFAKKKEKPEKASRQRPYALLGFLYMFINVSTLIPFIAAVKDIAAHKLSLSKELGTLAIVISISMLMIAFPVIVTYTMPNKSKRVLDPTTRFFTRYGMRISKVYFLIIAVYLLVKGIAHL